METVTANRYNKRNGTKTIEIFKTNITDTADATRICSLLLSICPHSRITIDTEDRDSVLRIDGRDLNEEKIITLMSNCGFYCEPLTW